MFGKPQTANGTTPRRIPAGDVAKIQGGGLVQVIVTQAAPLEYHVFLNERYVPPTDLLGLSVTIEAPPENSPVQPVVRATLSRYVTNVTGERTAQRTELFPCTLEIIALGRRISVNCTRPDSLDGLWIDLGLKPDGSGSEVSGAQTLNILLEDGLLDAKLTWTDGTTDDLLPQ